LHCTTEFFNHSHLLLCPFAIIFHLVAHHCAFLALCDIDLATDLYKYSIQMPYLLFTTNHIM